MQDAQRRELNSPNFAFLAKHDSALLRQAALAERYVFEDPNAALIKIRQLAETLAKGVAARVGIPCGSEESFRDVEAALYERRLLDERLKQVMREVRRAGNAAAHSLHGERREALHSLKLVRQIAIWFHKVTGNEKFRAGPFVPPPPPTDADAALKQELLQLRESLAKANADLEGIRLEKGELDRRATQEAQRSAEAFANERAALEIAEETEAELNRVRIEYEEQLAELAKQRVSLPEEEQKQIVAASRKAAEEVDLDEQATRKIIDQQLRDVGWEADTTALRHSKGARPQKGKNLAIAEWPTANGPADYVLFAGLTPLAVVEAKRRNTDVAGKIPQSKRYSIGYQITDEQTSAGGPWGECQVPFLFSANGRDYLKQLRTKSGIWFLDARRSTNHPRPLVGWYSPRDLKQLLKHDVEDAEAQLESESPDYLPLRFYQQEAVQEVEKRVIAGQREMLLAMATGTGKTRTCIGICYRLIKSKRFRRVLFLVDRTSLGEQTGDALRDLKLENNQTFSDIYDVKELGDITPEADTKFQIATIQGMVRRLLDSEDGEATLSVGQYDCIVVDECHRGYNLDQELSDSELRFRDEADYISKYSRVLDYFDAVKIGLTATPALHTIEIFGGEDQLPIYQYSYRQAVIDGFLVDHEPPLRIVTQLAQDGISWQANEEVTVYDTGNQQLELFNTPDDIHLEVESFNKRVVNENFNRVICAELAKHIDPNLPGKTLIFCVTDMHADMVVDELKSAFAARYDEIEDDAVMKITGKADKPSQLIRRFKNEQLPSVVVTVDLLTTGIDVPEITNLVFLRRVSSRILYEQMIGRGTRLCPQLLGPEKDKDCFRIFDCVDLYSELQNHTDMRPVITRPNITFGQLVEELGRTTNPEDQETIKEQLIAKLQRKRRSLHGDRAQTFEDKSGVRPESLLNQIRNSTPEAIVEWFSDKSALVEFLDQKTTSGGVRIYVSEDADEVIEVATGFGQNNKRPLDYLEEFREYVVANQDQIAALKLCAQRPRDLTRKALRELQIELDNNGFSEKRLQVAWREAKNVDIAATIIGFVRNAVLDAPLRAFDNRVNYAMQRIMASKNWTQPQRQWLERIGKQFKENTLVDREAVDQGQFKEYGGFDRLNKVFDGELGELLGQITDEIWSVTP